MYLFCLCEICNRMVNMNVIKYEGLNFTGIASTEWNRYIEINGGIMDLLVIV